MKATTNAYGMDAGAGIWERRFGNPHGRTLRGVTRTLSDGTRFSMEAYQKAQEGLQYARTRFRPGRGNGTTADSSQCTHHAFGSPGDRRGPPISPAGSGVPYSGSDYGSYSRSRLSSAGQQIPRYVPPAPRP